MTPAPGALPAEAVERYLRLLGLPRKPPSLAALGELVSAHLGRVPFESLSKLLRRRAGRSGLPDLELHLGDIERLNLGGTCYANNLYLGRLLASLGYPVRLCGADMRQPDVHLVVVVTLAGRDYLVDAGYAAPFHRPMPLDARSEQVVEWGAERYLLAPRDGAGRSRLEQWRDGALRHGYLVKPESRAIEEFQGVIEASFRPDATFLNALVVARFFPEGSLRIENLTLAETSGGRTRTSALRDRVELAREVERLFGIPREVVAQAAAELPEMKGVLA